MYYHVMPGVYHVLAQCAYWSNGDNVKFTPLHSTAIL